MTHAQTIACIGAGRMGRGIAQCVAYAGHRVKLLDAKSRDESAFAELKKHALDDIQAGLVALADLGVFDHKLIPGLLQRIEVFPLRQASAALTDASLVFEGVPELLAAKREAFALFDCCAVPEAILASTTSTILSTVLAEFTERPDRFLNAHWLNPAFLMPLIELSPTPQADPQVITQLSDFLHSIGKVTVQCQASPGYIVPRIQALAMNEAARLVEEGVASAEDVDKAVRYGFGLRFAVFGLLEFTDWGGGDILYHASRYLSSAFDDPRFAPAQIIADNMRDYRIGLSTGAGLYDYANVDVQAYRRRKLGEFVKVLRDDGLLRDPVIGDGDDEPKP